MEKVAYRATVCCCWYIYLTHCIAFDKVPSHKVLGLIFNDTLMRNEDINEIVAKASRRLYIIRMLRRAGIPPHDLLHIYFTLIRSVLEYGCVAE